MVKLNISLNEYEDALRYKEERDIDSNFYNKLRVLANYYFEEEGCSEKKVREKLSEYVCFCGESPSLNIWSDMIDAAIKRAKKVKLIRIEEIKISESEIERINCLESTQLKRLAFTLLCLAKYRDLIVKNNDHWICYEDKEIMKLANMRPSLTRQAELYKALSDMEYLKFPKKIDSISMQILFTDKEQNNNTAVTVTKFKNLGYQYLKYCGEPYFECENCGTTVKQVNNKGAGRKQKYCEQCAALIHAKQKTESVMRLKITRASSQ